MTLKNQILELPQKPDSTYKQKSFLRVLTGLKFWEVEHNPPPSVEQAALLISALKAYIDNNEGNPHEIAEAIQIWFSNFNDISQFHYRRGGGRKKSNTNTQSPEPKPEPEQKPKQEPKPESEPEPEPEPEQPQISNPKNVVEDIQARIQAGLRNLWLVGPAGCGKTTMCQIVGEILDLPVTLISCGAGTSATTFLGYKYPEREATPFVNAFSQPGIIVLDEFTSLEDQVAQVANSALANNQLNATTGTFTRDPDCIIIATSNTYGFGGDRTYTANNQLDGATIDRFACGFIDVDYSSEYENKYDLEVVRYVRKMRKVIETNGMRKIASTRSIINASMLKKAGLNWKQSLTVNWATDEKVHI